MTVSTLAISSITPSAESLGVSVKTNITLTFNKNVDAGASGYISLYNTTNSPKVLVEKFSPSSSRLTYSGLDLVIDITDDLSGSQTYSIEIDRGAIISADSNDDDVIAQTSGYSFSTEVVVDTAPPTIVSTLPNDDSLSVATDSSLSIKFDENIKFGTTGVVTIRKLVDGSPGAIFATYIVGSSSQLSILGNTLIIDPAGKFLAETEYTVSLGNGSITDTVGNKILGGEIFHFTTGQDGDPSPPVVLSPSSPSGSTVLPSQFSNIIFSFSEFIQPGSGHTTLSESSDGINFVTFEDYDMTTTRRAYISGSDLIIDPTNPLNVNNHYRLNIGVDAIKDLAGNAYNSLGAFYSFTVVNEAFTHAIPVAFSPGRGVATASRDANIEITFSQDIFLNENTSIGLYKSDGTLIESFAINGDGESDRIAVYGSRIVIDPMSKLEFNSGYSLVIGNAVLDANSAPINFDYSFRTAPDRIAPIKISSSVDDSSLAGAAVTTNFLITFDETIKKGIGKIYLKDSNNKIIQTFDSKSSAVTIQNGEVDGVLIQNSQLKINPASSLGYKKGYKIVLDAKAVTDLSGNAIAALSGDLFTTPNRAPTAKSTLVKMNEDGAFVITKALLGYADADADPIVRVKLTDLPTHGTLTLDNIAVTDLNTEISIGEINSGQLVYSPVLNEYGNAYDIFKFKVSDGINYSVDDAVLTFKVTPVNDTPTISSDEANAITDRVAIENILFNYTIPENAFADVDAGDLLVYSAAQVINGRSVALPKWLKFDSASRTFSGTPADADSDIDLTIRVTATDRAKARASDDFILEVEGRNQAPQAKAITTAAVATEGRAFEYGLPKGIFTDGDRGDILTYSVSGNKPNWLSIDSATGRLFSNETFDFTAADIASTTLLITATDVLGLSASTNLSVRTVNTPTIKGTAAANSLNSGNGDDSLNGGGGDDALSGGSGNDVYIWDSLYRGNAVISDSSGTDSINYKYNGMAKWSLIDNNQILIQNLDVNKNIIGSLTFDAGEIEKLNITGAILNKILDTTQLGIFNESNANLGGLSNAMYLLAKTGCMLNGGTSDDFITGRDVSNVQVRGGAGADFINIDNFSETIAGDIVIDGGLGGDVMIGASPRSSQNIIFIVDNSNDNVIARSSGAHYFVESSVTYVLNDIEKERTGLKNSTKFVTDLTLTGGAAIDGTGNLLDNIIIGNDVANKLNGGAGNDTLSGGLGNDTYVYSFLGTDTIFDTGGDDLVVVTLPKNSGVFWNWDGATLEVSAKNNSANKLKLLNAADIEQISDGSRTFYLADAQMGSDSADMIVGLSADDNISAGNGADIVIAGTGNDTVDAGSGDDIVYGAGGDDTILGGAGKDALDGEEGADTASYFDKTVGISVVLNRSSLVTVNVNAIAEDTIKNIENIIGGSGNDAITGDSNNNMLNGGLGNDTLIGGAGNDTLIGGLGKDTLTGGTGSDYFVFNAILNTATNIDTIRDFNVVDDIIRLDNEIFTGLAEGSLTSDMFVKGANVTGAADGSDRIAYNTKNGALYYDADGVGGTAGVQIALIGNKAALNFDDFVVI